MGGNINKVILVGRLGGDPELHTAKSGMPMARFSLATSYRNGEREETTWHRVKAFGRTAESCAAHLNKGHLCYLEGRVSYRRYEKDDQVRYFTDIIAQKVDFLQRKGTGARASEQAGSSEFAVAEEQLPF